MQCVVAKGLCNDRIRGNHMTSISYTPPQIASTPPPTLEQVEGFRSGPEAQRARVLDVLTFGEAMIRLRSPWGESPESAGHFHVHVGGAELNVAIALAQLGFRSAWVSKLANDPLGRRIAGELRGRGVDISAVVWAADGRTGLYLSEHCPPPRGVTVHYDRTGSAFSTVIPEEVDWDYVRNARWIHLTGITLALSESCARTVTRILEEVRSAAGLVSFDVNYRRRLWTAQCARDRLEPLVTGVDILIATEADAREVLGLQGRPSDLAARMHDRYRVNVAIVTAGPRGAYLVDNSGIHHETALPSSEVDPVGRGDAFAAGVLWGALEGDLHAGMRYGVALAALAQAYWGDIPRMTRDDVYTILADHSRSTQRVHR